MYSYDRIFNFEAVSSNWLDHHDPCASHMFNAASIILPFAESFVNHAVIQYLPDITNERLLSECKKFIEQEQQHAKEHVKYNKQLAGAGCDVKRHTDQLAHVVRRVKQRCSPLTILALALGFESMTLFICTRVLSERLLGNAHSDVKAFWHWHMVEELEHKSVLMDLYQVTGGGYIRRITMFALVMAVYCYFGLKIYLALSKQQHIPVMTGLLRVFCKNTFFIKSLISAIRVFRYSFHPDCIHTHDLGHAEK